jgi:hypothetical protein
MNRQDQVREFRLRVDRLLSEEAACPECSDARALQQPCCAKHVVARRILALNTRG